LLSKARNSLGTFAAVASYQAELGGQYQVFSSMPRSQNSARLKVKTDLKELRLVPTVMLLSDDEAWRTSFSQSSSVLGSWFAMQPTNMGAARYSATQMCDW
jgi:hypothetical protein